MQDRPTVSVEMDALLDVLWRSGGTDLIITAGIPPQIRVQGELVPVPGHPALSGRDTDALLAGLLTPEQASSWDVSREYDFSFTLAGPGPGARQRLQPARLHRARAAGDPAADPDTV